MIGICLFSYFNTDLGFHHLAVDGVVGDEQDLVHAGRCGEGDEAEAPGAPGSRVLHNHHLCHVTEL